MKSTDIMKLHALPLGWQFLVEELVGDIVALEEKYNVELSIADAKEKWGGMTICVDGLTDEAWDEWIDIENKYRNISYYTCVSCGKSTSRRKGFALCNVCEVK